MWFDMLLQATQTKFDKCWLSNVEYLDLQRLEEFVQVVQFYNQPKDFLSQPPRLRCYVAYSVRNC